MNAMEHLELLDHYVVFRVHPEHTAALAIEGITAAIGFSREQHHQRLLVDVTRFAGERPSMGQRYFFIQEWAKVSNGKVRIAMLARPDLLVGQQFALAIVNSMRLNINIFISEEEAIRWLTR